MSLARPSQRILGFIDALPLKEGPRVLELGCGPGVAAREIAGRIGNGFVLAIDRSERAIEIARRGSAKEIASGLLAFRCTTAEDLTLSEGGAPFDLAFALRVGAFDGRYPEAGLKAMERLRDMMAPHGRFFVDTADPLQEIYL